ncbi:hypothetical protein LPC08_22680 [Roseomonas sp. OT10]|uniref:hypothetical protein n=1 Tax=Roseomonas cutis TaxID=2897332 RepID=UPI001E388704|nr:hypothetical protein [Roseomonas sp. OT10]UFN48774.1 hypothetical protein LPC08_22680 [Roseomonas sp. OT10]
MAFMLMEVLAAALQPPLNLLFTCAILALAMLAIAGVFLSVRPLNRLTVIAPGMLTALGVLGTFFGILVGLLRFNVADLNASVPLLLDGMKTAFVTSVIGTGSGLLVKLISIVVGERGPMTEDGGAEAVIALLGTISDEAKQTRRDMVAGLDRVRGSLVGDGDSSLVTQVQKLRNELVDELRSTRKAGQDAAAAAERTGGELRYEIERQFAESRRTADESALALVREVRGIAATLSEGVTAGLVKALEGLIRYFNSKLSEQFGENFKQLNAAVGRLLDWQEAYRTQMEANAAALREGEAGIRAARAGIEAIAASSGHLVQFAASMEATLTASARLRDDLERRLAAFRDMAEKAQNAFPTIQAKLLEMTEAFAADVRTAMAESRRAVDEFREATRAHGVALVEHADGFVLAVGGAASRTTTALERSAQSVESVAVSVKTGAEAAQTTQEKSLEALRQGFERLREDASTSGEHVRKAIDDLGVSLQERLRVANEASLAQLTSTVNAVAKQLQTTTEREFSKIADGLGQQIRWVDTEINKKFQDVVEDFGKSLVSITSHFASDYRPLADRLREILLIVERSQNFRGERPSFEHEGRR